MVEAKLGLPFGQEAQPEMQGTRVLVPNLANESLFRICFHLWKEKGEEWNSP